MRPGWLLPTPAALPQGSPVTHLHSGRQSPCEPVVSGLWLLESRKERVVRPTILGSASQFPTQMWFPHLHAEDSGFGIFLPKERDLTQHPWEQRGAEKTGISQGHPTQSWIQPSHDASSCTCLLARPGTGIRISRLSHPSASPTSQIAVSGFRSISAFSSNHLPIHAPWRGQQVMAQVAGALPPTWEAQMEFQAPSCSMAPAGIWGSE